SLRSRRCPYDTAALPACRAAGGGVAVAVRIAGEGALVAIEDETDDFRRVGHVERLLQEFARRLVGGDHHEKPVHPFFDDPTIRNGNERRRVEYDEVVVVAG